jgi:hypothetical protein
LIAKNKPQTDLKIVDNQVLCCYDYDMKKINLPIITLFLLVAILMSLWWVRTKIGVLTPEDAAVHHVQEMKTGNFTIISNSVEAIQAVALKDQVLVLVQYSGIRPGEGVNICETVLETRKTLLNGWQVNSGAGLCHEAYPANSIPVTSGGGRGNATLLSPGYSTAYGLVRDPQITQVLVTWEDGHIQTVEVQESTYFAVREGGNTIKKIEAYNGQHELVYTSK